MRFFFKRKDGGPLSHVTGYWLMEGKRSFSIVLLRFDLGSREVFHNHAFNAFTLFLLGKVEEHTLSGKVRVWKSLQFKYTPRTLAHKVYGITRHTWAVSVRGPWTKVWKEYSPNKTTVLSQGRVEEYL